MINVPEILEFFVESFNQIFPTVSLLGELLGVGVKSLRLGVQLFLKLKN
jgi:hypothetical protein